MVLIGRENRPGIPYPLGDSRAPERALGSDGTRAGAAFRTLEAATRYQQTTRARASRFEAYGRLLRERRRCRGLFEMLAREIELGHRRGRPARPRPS
jgi:hypothetical protein